MSFFGLPNPFAADPPPVKTAKDAVETAKTAAKQSPSLDNDLAVIDAECTVEKEKRKATEAAKSGPPTSGTATMGGRRRKRKGGKHTKKHRKSGKGKSRASRRSRM